MEKDTVYWDSELTGFGVRVYPSGAKAYMVQSRGPNGLKRVTVGRPRGDLRRRGAGVAGGDDPDPHQGRVASPSRNLCRAQETARRWAISRRGISGST